MFNCKLLFELIVDTRLSTYQQWIQSVEKHCAMVHCTPARLIHA